MKLAYILSTIILVIIGVLLILYKQYIFSIAAFWAGMMFMVEYYEYKRLLQKRGVKE